jgi:CspA family cold shock protein
MPTGKVKWFDDQKGYGFILEDGTNEDVFVHYSSIEGEGYRSLPEGVVVQYEVEKGPKGLKATKVKAVSPPPGPA